MTRYACELADIEAAAGRLEGVAHRTPLVACATLDKLSGCRLRFKCEHLQKVGAFKFRGAWNAVAQLSEAQARRGVVTHSSGNHAQALALAARMRAAPAHIVMPSNAPAVKRRAVEGYGARVIECRPVLEDREATASRVLAETGGVLIPPYDDPRVIAGQGTIALEILSEAPDVEVIVAPVGGGGLISGICLAAREAAPSVLVIGAEPAGADDAARSRAAGSLIEQTAPRTIADGLLTSLGEWTWPVVRDCLADIVTVDDEAIVAALRLAWERAKLAIEPSAAVALAAVLSESFRQRHAGREVAVVLSGGNIDAPRVAKLLAD